MKARVTKKWWQFWLPSELEIAITHMGIPIETIPGVEKAKFYSEPPTKSISLTHPLTGEKISTQRSAVVEANEAQPWYTDQPHQPTGGQIVEAVPDIVAKSQGTQMMRDRMEQRHG